MSGWRECRWSGWSCHYILCLRALLKVKVRSVPNMAASVSVLWWERWRLELDRRQGEELHCTACLHSTHTQTFTSSLFSKPASHSLLSLPSHSPDTNIATNNHLKEWAIKISKDKNIKNGAPVSVPLVYIVKLCLYLNSCMKCSEEYRLDGLWTNGRLEILRQ